MNPEKQRIAIAGACGWKLVMDNPLYEPYWEDPKGNMIGVSCGMRFPNYLNDLNAMHEAEKETDVHYSQKWTTTLCEVMFESTSISVAGATKWDFALLCARSTAAQRAEAFLKTLNLWTE
jgi:hypothetical protein